MSFKDSGLVVYTSCVINRFDLPFSEICLKHAQTFLPFEKKNIKYLFFGVLDIGMFITQRSACEIEL